MTGKKLEETWQRRIKEFKSSDLTQKEWCKENGESIHKLRYWLYKRNKKESQNQKPQQWLSVKVKEQEMTNSRPITIKIGKAVIEVKQGFDQKLLADVLRTVNSL